MDWLWFVGGVLVIAVLAGIVGEILYGPQDRAMHARERAAQAAHDARMARMKDPHAMAQEALLRAAANNPRGAALYEEYMRGVRRQRDADELAGGDDRG
jgi:hypothetical protein